MLLVLPHMSDEKIHPNVQKVTDAARAAGFEIQVKKFPEGTKTAQDAATAIGVSVGQIVKSLVFGVDDEIVMALVSGSNQLDEKKLAAAAGGAKCKRVDAGHRACRWWGGHRPQARISEASSANNFFELT
jgi:prolyl-tRNA editing enzyme YbaK/EbsC (Cys-tRNA(Pro) deacylase)